jgi:hypothetical protein
MKFDKNQKALLREGILSTVARLAKKLRKPTDSVGDNINRLDGIAGGPQGKLPGPADRTWNDALPVHRKINKPPAYKDPVGDKIDRLEGIAGGPQGKLPGKLKRRQRPDWVEHPVVKEGAKKRVWKLIKKRFEPSTGKEAGKAIDATRKGVNQGIKAGYPPSPDLGFRTPRAGKKIDKISGAPGSVVPYRYSDPNRAEHMLIKKDPKMTQHNLDLAKQQLTAGQKAKILGLKTAAAGGTAWTGAGFSDWRNSKQRAREAEAKELKDAAAKVLADAEELQNRTAGNN